MHRHMHMHCLAAHNSPLHQASSRCAQWVRGFAAAPQQRSSSPGSPLLSLRQISHTLIMSSGDLDARPSPAEEKQSDGGADVPAAAARRSLSPERSAHKDITPNNGSAAPTQHNDRGKVSTFAGPGPLAPGFPRWRMAHVADHFFPHLCVFLLCSGVHWQRAYLIACFVAGLSEGTVASQLRVASRKTKLYCACRLSRCLCVAGACWFDRE
jgi:hypothetical protein